MRTLGRAVQLAQAQSNGTREVRIVVYPGTYREAVQWMGGARPNAPITIEAKEAGTATLSGSDVWGGWRREGTTNVYSHSWPYRWGLAAYPPGWKGQVDLQPIVRRREMIFVNDAPLTQVLSRQEVKAGTFYVAEDSGTVFLAPPANVAMDGATVEVTTRAGLVIIKGLGNLTVRGLTFIHDGMAVDGAAVAFSNCNDLLVENCQFLWNNWTAFSVHASNGVVARDSVANHNGAIGMEAYQVKDVLYERNETSQNNWRGAMGNFYTWATGGLKHLLVHGGVYRQHRSIENQACGCWFDTDCANIEVDAAFCCRNYGEGIFIEASQGPVTVANSTICHSTQGPGVYSEGATDVTLRDTILYGNGDAQIRTLKGTRPVTNWETHEAMQLVAERWTLQGNVIVGVNGRQNLIDIANGAAFLPSLASDDNIWFSPRKSYSFVVDQKGVQFDGWQAKTAQDTHSLLTDPGFVDPDNDNFDVRPDSPIHGSSSALQGIESGAHG